MAVGVPSRGLKMNLCPFWHRLPLPAPGRRAHSPEGVQDCAVGEEADEPVSHGDLMEEGLLGLHNVRVRHPEELHEARVQGDTLVAFEHQPLVRPALSEVDGGRVVLGGGRLGMRDERKIPKSEGVKSYSPPHLPVGQVHRSTVVDTGEYICLGPWPVAIRE